MIKRLPFINHKLEATWGEKKRNSFYMRKHRLWHNGKVYGCGCGCVCVCGKREKGNEREKERKLIVS